MSSQISEVDDIKGTGLVTKICIGVGAVVLIGGSIIGILALVNVISGALDNSRVAEAPNSQNDKGNTSTTLTQPTDDEEKKSDDQNADDTEQSDNSNQTQGESQPANSSNTPATTPSTMPTTDSGAEATAGQYQSNSQSDTTSSRPDQITSPMRSDWQGVAAVSDSPASSIQPILPGQTTEPETRPNYNLNDNYVYATCEINDTTFDVTPAWAVAQSEAEAEAACRDKLLVKVRKDDAEANLPEDGVVITKGDLTEALCAKSGLSCGRW